MEYQKIINLLDNSSNQPPRFRTRNLVETNDESRGTYPVASQIKFVKVKLKCQSLVYVITVTHTYLLREK